MVEGQRPPPIYSTATANSRISGAPRKNRRHIYANLVRHKWDNPEMAYKTIGRNIRESANTRTSVITFFTTRQKSWFRQDSHYRTPRRYATVNGHRRQATIVSQGQTP